MTTVELPAHIAETDQWKDWPRKLEAHLKWGLRQRQIEAFVRNGKLRVYACPDDTRRLDPDALRDLFGEPGVVQGRARDISASERRVRQTEAIASATADPVALMFGKAVGMMESLHAQLIGQLRVVSDPLKVLLDAYRQTIEAQSARILQLESRADEADRMRSELADAKQERDIELKRNESRERRRDETLQLLKDQLPAMAKTWLEGNSLSEFARRTPKQAVEIIIESGSVSEQDADILRRAAGIPKPATEPTNQANGAAS